VEIDFQAMMIRLIAAPDSGQKGGEKLITASPSTNDDIPRIICVFQKDQRVRSNTRIWDL